MRCNLLRFVRMAQRGCGIDSLSSHGAHCLPASAVPLPFRRCRPDDLRYACVTILNMNPDSPSRQTLYHTLLDLYLSPAASEAGAQAASTSAAAVPEGALNGSGSSGGGAGIDRSSSSGNNSSSRREALDLLR